MIAQRAFERPAALGDLPSGERFCRTAQLTDFGVVLGDGIVLAPLARRGDGAVALAVEGREAEIFALLSLARGGAVRPNVLHGFHGVSKSLARGEIIGATIRLAQIGLPVLRGPRDAEMLKAGAMLLGKGFSPWAILQAPNGEPVGYVYPRADSRTRTVASEQFDQLQSQLMDGSIPVAAPKGYDGAWYQRADGTTFGIRLSTRNGTTIDVVNSGNSDLPSGFKVHRR